MAERNPVATADQEWVEREALKLTQHPEIRKTFAEVREHWLKLAEPSPDQRRLFDTYFPEVMFCAAVWSLNQDPQRPRVTCITRLPHKLGDLDIPGSRYGLDNPDTVYRIIPISGDERYVIKGKVGRNRLTENYFTLWDPVMNTVDVLNGKKLQTDADGNFEVTVNSEPHNGRTNHVQSSPKAHEFYIRDVLLDWSKDDLNELSIVKEGPPRTPPRSLEEQVELTRKFMWNYANNTHRWNQQALKKEPNQFQFTIDRDTDGALRNQIYILGQYKLAQDEALIINLRTGGAEYFTVPVTNVWGCTNEIINGTGCLNKWSSVANPDGSYSFVVSRTDPGVYNWVDTSGTDDGIITLRWAEFPGGRAGPEVGADSKLVKLSELKTALPAGTKWVTAAERKAQIETRAKAYLRRLGEN
jgi:hypothetical protein